jgi:exopolyphosphatase/pppGpp-phosphohydrolase
MPAEPSGSAAARAGWIRFAVLDIGSASAHLRIAGLMPGAAPEPVASVKRPVRLAEATDRHGAIAGPYAKRTLERRALARWIPELAARTDLQRAKLRGVKASRAHQILAGAVAADAIMDILHLRELDICPWALREGILLDRLGALERRQPGAAVQPPDAASTARGRRNGTGNGLHASPGSRVAGRWP